MLMRIFAMLAMLAGIAQVPVQAQYNPWRNDESNPPPRPNIPGQFDYYALVLSWSPTYCATTERGNDDTQCARDDGRRFGFVLHGLWPQYEQGYPASCRTIWRPFVPETVIDSLLDAMPSRGLIIHEYRAHGTCSGMQPGPYFALARRIYDGVRIPERYRNPYETQFVSPRELMGDFLRENPGLTPDMIAITCGGPGNRLREVRICMTKDGRPRACGRNEAQRKLCSASQMHVPPVRSTRWNSEPTRPKKPTGAPALPKPRLIH
jgi:ribonuclease T2